jgi:hypothetical protein
VANDRISGLTRQSASKPNKPRIPKSLLQFWRHADCMFKLLSEAWTCQCKGLHCAKLWLKQRIVATVDMKVMLQFCHGARKCVHIQLAEDLLPGSGSNSGVSIKLPLRPIGQQPNLPSITVQQTSSFAKASTSSSCVTVTRTSSKVSWASGHQQQQQQQGTTLPSIRDLSAHDLCDTIKVANNTIGVGECYRPLLHSLQSQRSVHFDNCDIRCHALRHTRWQHTYGTDPNAEILDSRNASFLPLTT